MESFLQVTSHGALELRKIVVVLVIPAAHCIGGHALAIGSEHLVHRLAARLAENVPQCDVDGSEREGRDTLDAVILQRLPKICPQPLGESGILSDENGLEL